MPVSFARLRITGFKSFAEPVNVEIRPGLTGIVGPNGCGKSNVIEALRWGMGESNARTLRGAEMDDVIFAGTAGRPSRNLAEVALTLEDTEGVAPPPFGAQAELEIIRKLERGGASAYRVNGREMRARDVQTLFADLASGARASAMVSQGKVSALVSARPEERRAVLEEAAGITGLHARRHEAELKLKAAEANLARAEDRRGQLEAQLAGLKRQARQASRYRNLSGAIRAAEAELFAVQRAVAEANRALAEAALAAARAAAGTAAGTVAGAIARAEAASAALPGLRAGEAEARTALERQRLAQESRAAEEIRARAALEDAERRLAQIARDLSHAEQVSADAAAAAARLAGEEARLTEAVQALPARREAAETRAAEAGEAARTAEAEANRATEAAATSAAEAQSVTQQREAAATRARRLAAQHAEVTRELAAAHAQAVDPARIEAAAAAQLAAEAAVADARAALELAEAAQAEAQVAVAAARARASAAETAGARLGAEARALAEVLGVKDNERWPPMVDALTVPPGLEAALGAALGEELSSAADRGAARHWRDLAPLAETAALPDDATPLGTLVGAPPALGRALSCIGLVEDEAAGEAAQADLAPGQTLVSRTGAVWRWDGYTIRAGAPTAAAVRLAQRNRLTVLRAHLAEAETERMATVAARTDAEAAERATVASCQRARAGRRDAEQAAELHRAAVAQLRTQAAGAAAGLAAVEQRMAALAPDLEEARTAQLRAEAAFAALPDLDALRRAVAETRAALGAARTREAESRAARDALIREAEAGESRLRAIAAEQNGWRERAADAAGRVADLAARRAEAEADRAIRAAAPASAAAARAAGEEALAAAEDAHRRAAATLAAAERDAAEAERAARAAEAAAGTAREAVVRAEAAAEAASFAWGTVAERILERLGADPALPALTAPADAAAEETARRRLDRLVREREEMGPVNLRAEVEVAELEGQIATIEREREEIGTAIARLRGSIGHLNREGRERLSAVFAEVDRHFQALFSRMFGGGRAHLALVGSDDPLVAGLEIFAQPPGKKLATLSLLSGGEQALTALSLIFAVFRCNPAPVSVLDEVDAPLDDANVERFCALLEDMVRETGTRFLVVTHHPLTMARMDRLYGVTMQERGVSRLLSVDLGAAVAMVEAPLLAAE